ncbi:glycerate kinase [Fictibacillus barbaricus]|uniref:Glycerate kinase n=1 Tax=Fictibacillus barbaricus TaxID=182136 RepID=A0ABS2Z7Y2_9BACL|nr:glycerate kinase [Fictibacillus barbaricus]MBN3544192.1 glycerate kinase [Fictibacillus barbaricus]GGB69678.1 glycerate kinase [Fictibacillus barbaricus]
MKVLIAIDSLKGSLSSIDASRAIREGISDVDKAIEVVTVPLADGGEGTVDALIYATQGSLVEKEVTGPLGNKIKAAYGILGDNTVAIEVAAACGLPLVPEEKRNPTLTTTYGVGELIWDAIGRGCRDFIIGLGGSATNDAGFGMLQALGYSFLDAQGNEIGLGGKELSKIRKIDVSNVASVLEECNFRVACDVDNPLFGENGAAYIFGPQKGATPEMVRELDTGLRNFADVTYRDLDRDIQHMAGGGAAGGLGAAFAGFLDGQLLSGTGLLLEALKMEENMADVDLVITGEGRLDNQTSMGKAPLGVANLAAKRGIPVVALAGGVTHQANELNRSGITSFFSIVNEPMTLEKAMDTDVAFNNLRMTTRQLFLLISKLKTVM